MVRRPNADLDALAVPKGQEPVPLSPPIASQDPTTLTGKNYAHTLSLRLTAEQYRRLRRHVVKIEEDGAGRITHQSVIEAALNDYLDKQGS